MNTQEYLKRVAYIDSMEFGSDLTKVYKSKFDDSYITHVGIEDSVKFLSDREITEELTHGVGFSPKNNKWYGWSHRAIFGFKIGSTCKKGDIHYNGSTLEEQEEDAIRFWSDDNCANVRSEGIFEKDGNKFFDVKWDYLDSVPNKNLHNTVGGSHHTIKPLGKGEWVAKTMADAKQMAVDFSENIS